MRTAIFALLALVAWSGAPANAQLTTYGLVYGEAGVLEWALVRWVGTYYCDTTCAFGNWMLMDLPATDSVRLECWRQGYYSQTEWTGPGTCDFYLVKRPPGEIEQRGDFNLNGEITAADIIGIIGHVFRGLPGSLWPPAADFNCDSQVTAADIVGVVNYVFRAGPASPCLGPALPYHGSPAGC